MCVCVGAGEKWVGFNWPWHGFSSSSPPPKKKKHQKKEKKQKQRTLLWTLIRTAAKNLDCKIFSHFPHHFCGKIFHWFFGGGIDEKGAWCGIRFSGGGCGGWGGMTEERRCPPPLQGRRSQLKASIFCPSLQPFSHRSPLSFQCFKCDFIFTLRSPFHNVNLIT